MEKRDLIRFVPALLWMILIFVLSNRPESGSEPFNLWYFVFRKMAHVFEYMILNSLIIFAMGLKKWKQATMISLLYAFSDEIHQLFIPGRSGLLRDVLIDSIGIFISTILFIQTPWKKNI